MCIYYTLLQWNSVLFSSYLLLPTGGVAYRIPMNTWTPGSFRSWSGVSILTIRPWTCPYLVLITLVLGNLSSLDDDDDASPMKSSKGFCRFDEVLSEDWVVGRKPTLKTTKRSRRYLRPSNMVTRRACERQRKYSLTWNSTWCCLITARLHPRWFTLINALYSLFAYCNITFKTLSLY